jgi:cobalt-zinc-cadmium efflux system outer membrane protein
MVLFLLVSLAGAREITPADALRRALSYSGTYENLSRRGEFYDAAADDFLRGSPPTAGLGLKGPDMKEMELSLSQPLRLKAQRRLPARQLEEMNATLAVQRAEIEQETAAAVLEHYITAVILQEKRALTDNLMKQQEQRLKSISARQGRGAASETARFAEEGILLKLRQDSLAIEGKLRSARAELAALWGEDSLTAPLMTRGIDSLFAQTARLPRAEDHPLRAQHEHTRSRAEAERTAAAAARLPQLGVSAAYSAENRFDEYAVQLGLSLTLPRTGKSRWAEKKADLLEREADTVLHRREGILETRLQTLRENRENLLHRRELLRSEQIPLAEETLAALRQQVKRGIASAYEVALGEKERIALLQEELRLRKMLLRISSEMIHTQGTYFSLETK